MEGLEERKPRKRVKRRRSRTASEAEAAAPRPVKRLYSLREAAEYLGRPVWSIRTLIWKGELPFVKGKGSRKQYIDVYDLDEYIKKNKEGGPTS